MVTRNTTHSRTRTSRSRWRRLVEFRDVYRLELGRYQNRIRNFYDGPAGAMLSLASMVSLHEPLIGRLLKQREFDVAQFKSILDIGAGAGQILGHLVKRSAPDAQIVAVDLSHQMLRRARKRVESDRPVYVAADMLHLPFADKSFDCITCGWVIEYFSDPRPALTELSRVLTPGGSLLMMVTESGFAGALTSRTWRCRTFTRSEFRHCCEDVGLIWHRPMWFTKVHKILKFGGIVVEVRKPELVNGTSTEGK